MIICNPARRTGIDLCLNFDGANDQCVRSAIGNWRNQTTWEWYGWVQPEDLSASQVIFYWYYTTAGRIGIVPVDVPASSQFYIRFYFNDASSKIESGNLDYGTKYFVGCQFDGGAAAADRYKLYINGISAGTLTGTPPTTTHNLAAGDLYIGTTQAGLLPFKGKLAQSAVRYNRTILTSDEVYKLYKFGYSCPYEELGIFDSVWAKKEGTGTTVYDRGLDGLNLSFGTSPASPTWTSWLN